MLGFKSFRSAGNMLAGVELMHMIRKGQFAIDNANAMSFADQANALVGQAHPVSGTAVSFLQNSFSGSITRQNQ